MPQQNFASRGWNRNLRALLACAIACAAVLAWTPVRAADDDDEAPDTKFLQKVLKGFGLQDGSEKGIDYRERSPLVIPPSRTLPPPEKDAATSNPNWPVDPEIKARRELKAASRTPPGTDPWAEAARPLRPDELNRGPRVNSTRDAPGKPDYEAGKPLSQKELGYKGGLLESLFKKQGEETAPFRGEPPRVSLTEPPPGYQTPSPSQPYGLGKDRTATKPVDYLLEHGTKN